AGHQDEGQWAPEGPKEGRDPNWRGTARPFAQEPVLHWRGPFPGRGIRNQLLSGSDDSIGAMSARIGMNKFRLTSLVRLSYLAPGIIRALLAGQHPIALTPTRLLRLSKDLPHDWKEQRHFLGLAA